MIAKVPGPKQPQQCICGRVPFFHTHARRFTDPFPVWAKTFTSPKTAYRSAPQFSTPVSTSRLSTSSVHFPFFSLRRARDSFDHIPPNPSTFPIHTGSDNPLGRCRRRFRFLEELRHSGGGPCALRRHGIGSQPVSLPVDDHVLQTQRDGQSEQLSVRGCTVEWYLRRPGGEFAMNGVLPQI